MREVPVYLRILAPLRAFRVQPKNKDDLRLLLYRLQVNVFGWNIDELFKKYCLDVNPRLSEKHHYRSLVTLVAILISGDNEQLVDDPSAQFPNFGINEAKFRTFSLHFVDELQKLLQGQSKYSKPVFGLRSYPKEIVAAMTDFIYTDVEFRNPAASAITTFFLMLFGTLYKFTFLRTAPSSIVEDLAHMIVWPQCPTDRGED